MKLPDPQEPGNHPVSILVFVELALDAGSGTMSAISYPSFNPCFRGTCS